MSRRRATGARAVLAAACLAAGVLGSGCAEARNDLGTSDASCYVALPAASAATHGAGRLLGLRLVRADSLDGLPVLASVASAAGHRGSRVCLVAYAGRFTAATVVEPYGAPSGPTAVVVVTYPGLTLLGTVITRSPSMRFSHTHLFG